jgi:hypothetical protein
MGGCRTCRYAQPEEEHDLYGDFHHALLKEYVALVDSPFLLERLCMKHYKEDRFCSRVDLDWIREVVNELQQE